MDEQAWRNWTDRYVAAWGSNDPDEIGGLFTDDAVYYTAPWRQPWHGRAGIVEGWLDRKDEPGQWEFEYEVLAVAGDTGFVQGVTTYLDEGPTTYSNLWVIKLDEQGRASHYTEWWMEQT